MRETDMSFLSFFQIPSHLELADSVVLHNNELLAKQCVCCVCVCVCVDVNVEPSSSPSLHYRSECAIIMKQADGLKSRFLI